MTETQGTATTCSSVILGDFSNVLVGLREGIGIQVLTERYAADSGQIGFVLNFRGDVVIPRPATVCRLVGVKP